MSAPEGAESSGPFPGAVIAIDPGREKCGLAAVKPGGSILCLGIIKRSEIVGRVLQIAGELQINAIALGHSTQSKEVHAELMAARPDLQIEIIDERNSTFEARKHYWASNPPRGWRKLVPLSLQAPPEPIDDWAAFVLAQRYFAARPPRTPG